MRERLRKNEAAKPSPVFSARTLRGRPLADTSPARVVREAFSSENPVLILPGKPLVFPNPFPRLRNLRFAGTREALTIAGEQD